MQDLFLQVCQKQMELMAQLAKAKYVYYMDSSGHEHKALLHRIQSPHLVQIIKNNELRSIKLQQLIDYE